MELQPNLFVKIRRDAPVESDCWVAFHMSSTSLHMGHPTRTAWRCLDGIVARTLPGWWITGVISRSCPYEALYF